MNTMAESGYAENEVHSARPPATRVSTHREQAQLN